MPKYTRKMSKKEAAERRKAAPKRKQAAPKPSISTEQQGLSICKRCQTKLVPGVPHSESCGKNRAMWAHREQQHKDFFSDWEQNARQWVKEEDDKWYAQQQPKKCDACMDMD